MIQIYDKHCKEDFPMDDNVFKIINCLKFSNGDRRRQ